MLKLKELFTEWDLDSHKYKEGLKISVVTMPSICVFFGFFFLFQEKAGGFT